MLREVLRVLKTWYPEATMSTAEKS